MAIKNIYKPFELEIRMKYILIAGLIILAVFLIVLREIPLGVEPLTEIYFENHTKLPKYLFPNNQYNYSFTVHNLEYTNMNYEYVINAENETNILSELTRGNISLKNNESITINENIKMKSGFERAKISIILNKITSGDETASKSKFYWSDENYAEKITIHFWIEEITGPKIIITPD